MRPLKRLQQAEVVRQSIAAHGAGDTWRNFPSDSRLVAGRRAQETETLRARNWVRRHKGLECYSTGCPGLPSEDLCDSVSSSTSCVEGACLGAMVSLIAFPPTLTKTANGAASGIAWHTRLCSLSGPLLHIHTFVSIRAAKSISAPCFPKVNLQRLEAAILIAMSLMVQSPHTRERAEVRGLPGARRRAAKADAFIATRLPK